MRSIKAIVGVLVIFLGFWRVQDVSGQGRYFWYYEIVDDASPVGTFTSLALDQNGLPRIAYCRAADYLGGLKYAAYDGEKWQIETVDGQTGFSASLALDSKGFPHISYTTVQAFAQLRYAFFDGEGWNKQVLDDFGEIQFDTSIDVDATDRVHVSYWVEFHPDGPFQLSLLYAYFDGDTWSVHERVDTLDNNGKWSDIVVDSKLRPHISYVSPTFGNLRHAFLEDEEWRTEQIQETDGAISQGWNNAIAIADDDRIAISFIDETNNLLKVALGSFGNWSIEVVDTVSTFTGSSTTSVQFDRDGSPIVSYHDAAEGDLKIAYKENGTWFTEKVDTVGLVGQYCSLQLDKSGLPIISYFDASRGVLRLARARPTPPNDTDADGVADYLEEAYGTDPRDVDTDDDGLSDGEEDLNGNGLVEAYELDPRNPDTDDDGVGDGTELGRTSGVEAPAGMRGTDMARFQADLDPTTQTNPLVADSDQDGLLDGREDLDGNGRVDLDETDPNNPDTDGDTLPDGLEVRRRLSPLDTDSDDDGLADHVEDKNQNGLWDRGETDPVLVDSDGDGLPDGRELGITQPVPDPDGPGRLLGTDLGVFRPDADPSTQTDPLRADTDGDGIKDGREDSDANGRFDPGETDPLNPDTDNDGLSDGSELLAGTDPLDIDSDDDGLSDQAEDTNRNGVVEAWETSPVLFDSDGDGLSDGLELGLTSALDDPDGEGPLAGTDGSVFVRDVDPSVNSNPLLWDTDGDGLSDGEEDANRNGAVDAGETHFLSDDSDTDGVSDGDEVRFDTNPLDPISTAEILTLLEDDFGSGSLVAWSIVDEGDIDGPSDWFTYENALVQTSNIHGGDVASGGEDPNRPGTFIWSRKFGASDYKIVFKMRSTDDDELGIMFHYRDPQNYFRFSMNREKGYRRLTKIVDGVPKTIVVQSFSYEVDRDYDVIVFAVGGQIAIYLDGKRIIEIRDTDLPGGSIAFYCWNNAGAIFKNVKIVGRRTTVVNHALIRKFTLTNQDGKNLLQWAITSDPSIRRIEVQMEKLGQLPQVVYSDSNTRSTTRIEGSYVDGAPWSTERYRLVLYGVENDILDDRTLANDGALIREFSLSALYPNPFLSSITLVVQVPRSVVLRYEIYDLLGRQVRVQEQRHVSSGWLQMVWDGRDDRGGLVPAGVYFVRVVASSQEDRSGSFWSAVKKIVRVGSGNSFR